MRLCVWILLALAAVSTEARELKADGWVPPIIPEGFTLDISQLNLASLMNTRTQTLSQVRAKTLELDTVMQLAKNKNDTAIQVLDNLHETFKARFKKKYSDRTLFDQALERIAEINKNTKLKWVAGLNQFSDMSWEQFADMNLISTKMSVPALPTPYKIVLPIFLFPPASFDWRRWGKVTPVKNQGGCGSCWAFAAVAAFESKLLIDSGRNMTTFPINQSEQQVLNCVHSSVNANYRSNGCSGGWSQEAFNYLQSKVNTREATMPYTAVRGACPTNTINAYTVPANGYRIQTGNPTAFKTVTPRQPYELKKAVYWQGPVVSYLRVSQSFQDYGGGIYQGDAACNGAINHAVTVVGYSNVGVASSHHWIIKNSWGTNWGESGYMRIAYQSAANSPGTCNMYGNLFYPTSTQYQ